MKPGMASRQLAGIAVAAVGVWLGSAGAASAATDNIFTVAGNGVSGFTGDHGPATNARLNSPYGVAQAPDGAYYIADLNNDRVRRVGTDGIITTVAGTGTAGFSGDGGLATAAKLDAPTRVAVRPDGSIVIADWGNDRIRQVSPAGVITTIAGTATPGYSGDGGPATAAQLNDPIDVAVASDGGVLIADRGNDVVRRVSPSGTITTVAGTGTGGYSGDGGPGTSAMLQSPSGVAAAPDGAVLISDASNRRVRRLAGGVITTFAGNGTNGDSGDGGPATAAALAAPRGLEVAPDGSVLVADFTSGRIRRVAPDGIITTLVGTGVSGYSGDGVPAVAAKLAGPADVTLTPGGGVLIADYDNRRIRWVDADLRPAPSGGSGSAAPAPAPAATAIPARLAIALGFTRISMRSGRTVTVRYGATVAAKVTLKLRRSGHTVKTLTRNAHGGRNTIRVRMPRRTGRYSLDLKAVSSDGQVATDRARVTLTRR